jgi:magnesium chelatase family protein
MRDHRLDEPTPLRFRASRFWSSQSARDPHKVLRGARTIADLEGQDEIKPQYIAETVGYHSLDRNVWM